MHKSQLHSHINEMKAAFGGVIINEQAQVLLREPSGHYDGYVWTFAKGTPNQGETPEQTALREVVEETGILGRIIARIPGKFPGSTTSNEFFLMSVLEDTRRFHRETQAIQWVSQDEAKRLIRLTSNQTGRKRDLAILEAAFDVFNQVGRPPHGKSANAGRNLPEVVQLQLTVPDRRRALRVLTMVHELHKAGYQRLRICPGVSPSGCYWRCTVTPVSNILRSNGALISVFDHLAVHYSSGQENDYFGWRDAKKDTARNLAAKFVQRFPEIAQAGLGEDWAYAGWYVQMLGLAERDEFPEAYADWHAVADPRWLPTERGLANRLPMPPPGEAPDQNH